MVSLVSLSLSLLLGVVLAHAVVCLALSLAAPWCGPCRMVGPIIDEVSNDYEGKAVVGKVDVDANQEFAAKYGVRNIPTVLVFKNGEIVSRQVGVSPKQVYTDAIDAAM